MQPYLEDRNGVKYFIKRLNRKDDCTFMEMITDKEDERNNIDKYTEFCWFLMNKSFPEMSRDQFEDILNYNHEEYGLENLLNLLSAIVMDSFQSPGGKKPSYLVEREKHQIKEMEQTQAN